jgi:hypothetical protein
VIANQGYAEGCQLQAGIAGKKLGVMLCVIEPHATLLMAAFFGILLGIAVPLTYQATACLILIRQLVLMTGMATCM